jgi:hypothetical protein
MGCVDQNRYCNPVNSVCTPYSGWMTAPQLLDDIEFNPAQLATAARLGDAAENAITYSSVGGMGSGALLAKELSFQFLSPGLPSDQWRKEAMRWFETSLAKLQSQIVAFAANDLDLGPYGYISPAHNFTSKQAGVRDSLVAQCGNQLIQSSGQVQSFSFLGLMIVVCVTAVLLVAALSLERCMALWRRRSTSPKKIARQADEKLHLLRIALSDGREAEDMWRNGALDVPVLSIDGEMERPSWGMNGLAAYGYHQSSDGMAK